MFFSISYLHSCPPAPNIYFVIVNAKWCYLLSILLLQVGCSRQNSARYVIELVEPSAQLKVQ